MPSPRSGKSTDVLLLDTHVWLWLAVDSKRLSRSALAAIQRATEYGSICVASISFWELASQSDQGRILALGTIQSSVRAMIDSTSGVVDEISAETAALKTAFPRDLSADPADRLIATTARSRWPPPVTHDRRMLESSLLKTMWRKGGLTRCIRIRSAPAWRVQARTVSTPEHLGAGRVEEKSSLTPIAS